MGQAGRGEGTRAGIGRCGRRAFCLAVSSGALAGLVHVGSAAGRQRDEKEMSMAKRIKEVRAKVVSAKGMCELGHKVGDVVVFTDTGVEGRICIHALYSMMPKVFAMMFNAEFPWAQEHPDTLTHPCPDAANPVVFELTRVRD